ncbi:amidohydrolase [Acidaminobacter sp. JC074]|uniref:M20 metallopeptidase family protein n=1 Tax=Acidaminobacter sp. JC074 TaxID=2530199 RepID=UPI001F0D0941|nr:M20 family metallopeptidase [Acidaminobacter sp. JC074]MCH4887458.1 amidohydrolase [Acidaminobacter sp. JC074]
MNVKERINQIFDQMVTVRRHLHMHPELSNEEFKTQAYIMSFLNDLNIDCKPCAKTGVIASIGSKKPCIGIRADIDALPIQEINQVDYKSKHQGVMHACGHDVHTTILLGTAKILKEMEDELENSVKLFFQPAEETTGGALPMIEDGALEGVDYVFGLHVMPYLEVGQIEVKHGQLNASSNGVEIKLIGKTGHGAYPEKGVDSIMVSANLLTSLQTIVSRNTSPLDSTVLSFGTIHGGSKSNIICDEVTLSGTLRTLSKESRAFSIKRIQEITEHIAKAHGADCRVTILDGYEPLVNNNDLVDYIEDTLEKDFDIVYKDKPSLGVEDFSYFSNRVPGAFYHLGCSNHRSDSLHQNDFDVDENCIKSGILSQVMLVLNMK